MAVSLVNSLPRRANSVCHASRAVPYTFKFFGLPGQPLYHGASPLHVPSKPEVFTCHQPPGLLRVLLDRDGLRQQLKHPHPRRLHQ